GVGAAAGRRAVHGAHEPAVNWFDRRVIEVLSPQHPDNATIETGGPLRTPITAADDSGSPDRNRTTSRVMTILAGHGSSRRVSVQPPSSATDGLEPASYQTRPMGCANAHARPRSHSSPEHPGAARPMVGRGRSGPGQAAAGAGAGASGGNPPLSRPPGRRGPSVGGSAGLGSPWLATAGSEPSRAPPRAHRGESWGTGRRPRLRSGHRRIP